MPAAHEPGAGVVDEMGTLAPKRLRDERLLPRRALTEVEHRRVELHELEVGDPGPGAQGRGHAVTRRHRWVGRRGVDLAEPARREHDRATVGCADPVDLALADDVEGHAAHGAVRGGEQVDDDRVLDDLDTRVVDHPVERRDERPGDLRAGGVTPGMGDAVAVVAAFAGQRDLSPGVPVELRAEGHELAHPVRALGDECPHRIDVAQADPRHQGVLEVLVGGVLRVQCGGDPALGPLGGPGREHRLRHEENPVHPLPETQRAGEPGDAGPDHDDVGTGGPSRRGSGEATWQRHGGGRHTGPHTSARAWGTSEKTSSTPPPGPTSTGVLSMSRVVPTLAATARSASPRYHSGTSASVCGWTRTR